MPLSGDVDTEAMTDAVAGAAADVAGHAAAVASRAKDAVTAATKAATEYTKTATDYAKEVPGKLSDTAHLVADETSKRLPDEMPRRRGLMYAGLAVVLIAIVVVILRRKSND